MHTELVSVIIPANNRIQELKRSIISALNQSHKNLEVLVIENNSIDPSGIDDIANEICDSRLHIYHLHPCANANVARNYGVNRSSGEFVAFLDSDDEWLPEHVSNAMLAMIRSDADFVYGSFFVWNGRENKYNDARNLKSKEHPLEYLFGSNNAWAPTPSFFVARKVFAKVWWDETLKRHQDFDFFINVVSNFKSVANFEYDVKVNWIRGEKRHYDADSIIRFLNKWQSQMTFGVYVNFVWGKMKESIKRANINNFFYFYRCLLTRVFKYVVNS